MQSETQNGNSLFHNLFLLIVVIIMPISVAYFAMSNFIEEQYQARREVLKNDLDLQAARVKLVSTPTYQLNSFFQTLIKDKKLLRQNPETMKKLVERVEELYPGAFNWLFWDGQGEVLPMNSKLFLTGQKQWQVILQYMMAQEGVGGMRPADFKTEKNQNRLSAAIKILQRATGSYGKVEAVFWGRSNPVPFKWLGKDCLAVWEIDATSYSRDNIPIDMSGGAMLLAFADALPENFWLSRLVTRRDQQKEGLKYPLAAVNLTLRQKIAVDENLGDAEFFQRLINAYVKRSHQIFEVDNFLAKSTVPESGSQIRIFSLADLSEINDQRSRMLVQTRLVCILALLLGAWYLKGFLQKGSLSISLRRRIASIFMTAILLPIFGLLSIGNSFLAHERTRLVESALVKMRSGIEALELRFNDAPRLIEHGLFEELRAMVASSPSIANVTAAMEKAAEQDMILYYLLTNEKGVIEHTNWQRLDPAMKKTIEIAAAKLLEFENRNAGQENSLLRGAIEEEVREIIDSMDVDLDFSRPSHLRHFTFKDMQMYFMGMQVNIDQKLHALFAYLQDDFLERGFVQREFAQNLLATENSPSMSQTSRPELSFYSMFKSQPHLPVESEVWPELENSFLRSHRLKVEETGLVTFDNEEFIYLIKPLSTMFKQSYVPCLLSSMNPINLRIRDVRLVVAILALAAILGAVLLSLILAGSLLGPISQIDEAAQKIGSGDLNVLLPPMGADELGRLSQTFNDMVKGLRERERMQAYVSDSVLEAIQDQSDKSINDGKSIEVTILFSDIRNFTGISESNSPDQVFSLLNEYFGGIEPIIRENFGRVDKFIGDAVMAVFHQTSPEHHALSAAKTAFAMKQYVKKLNIRRNQAKKFAIEIGVGISTGTVLLGDIGSTRRKDLTVIGDEVNLASRLETASKKGRHSRIVVSGSTYELIKDSVQAEKMPFTEVRGKQQAVQIYELISLKK